MKSQVEVDFLQAEIDAALRKYVNDVFTHFPAEFKKIFAYQLGWEGVEPGKYAQGKRIRPLITLLTSHACGGLWKRALPAACGIELMHNFSLIHDDIQDNSELRRGRKTVWMQWGKPQAINAGDAMLAASLLCLQELQTDFSPEYVCEATKILQSACFKLTQGQYLDIAFEKEELISEDYYWQMINGKTSSLLSACFGLGALLAGAPQDTITKLEEFGSKLGLAFQVQDDWLGIWGNNEKTGKSTKSDLISRKKTYPILLGLKRNPQFLELWRKYQSIDENTASLLAKILEEDHIDEITKNRYTELYQQGMDIFNSIQLDEELSTPLRLTSESLIKRIY